MKTYPFISSARTVVLYAATLGTISLYGQDVPDAPTVADAPAIAGAPAADGPPVLGADQLEELVGPIALYPDALVALILPASTLSSDVVLAARFLKTGGNVAQIENQTWDDSVKGLTHYPDVVKWMDENLSWTQRLGEAYLAQPQAVMDAIQRARALARANGVLVDTPQQRVVIEDSYIRIIPAQRDVIYVPRYDPEIIYVQRPLYYHPDPWLTFGIGFGVGSWLSYDLDWRTHHIWVAHHRHQHWRHHHDWRYRHSHIDRNHWGHWKPSPGRHHRPHRDHQHWGRNSLRPAPLPGAPRFDRERWKRKDNNQQFTGGGRPGVVRPDQTRNRVSETHRSQHDSGGFRRHGSGTNLTPGSNNGTTAQVTAPQATPRDQQRRRDWEERNRADRPGVNPRFSERRSEAAVATPAPQNQFQTPRGTNEAGRPRGTNEAGVHGTSERRGRPADGGHVRHPRAGAPSISQAPGISQQRLNNVAATPAPQIRPPQQREAHQAPRVAPSPTPARTPAPAAARAPASSSNEVRASRSDDGPRASANYGGGRGGHGGRSHREGRTER